jgi:hypothetical protein
MTDQPPPAELALSIRRRLETIGQEAGRAADLQFVAYLIEVTLAELDDVIAATSPRH